MEHDVEAQTQSCLVLLPTILPFLLASLSHLCPASLSLHSQPSPTSTPPSNSPSHHPFTQYCMPTCLHPHLNTCVMMSFKCAKIDRGGVGGGSNDGDGGDGGGDGDVGVGVGSAGASEYGKHGDTID
ncbi:unnamed protein product [Taenia asiatica]|uniref:Uncharacterized protein n=1 Tax=Taenia asiatica TaxID=60517 RepID=A0A0R3VY56_TAEAS|nr:unnamed protein product [Taenia asiatica]